MAGAFSAHKEPKGTLFTFPSLMPRTGQELSMLVLPHLFAPFFDNATQQITSNLI
jgi:hypothetical protein